MKAVIPAAGLGSRFLPATKAQPKEMLPVVDKPAIQYIVEEALEAGVDEVIIVNSRDKKSIEDAVKDAREKLEKTDDVQEIQKIVEELSKVSDPVFSKLYQQGAGQPGAEGAANNTDSTNDGNADNID